jgi:hypothetical protein
VPLQLKPAEGSTAEEPVAPREPATLSIADAIAAANAWFVRAALLHSAASQLLADFAGDEPRYHVIGAFGVERRVPPEQLRLLVEELRSAVAAARAEAERMLGGGVVFDATKDIPALAPETTASVGPEIESLPPVDDCVVFNPRSDR